MRFLFVFFFLSALCFNLFATTLNVTVSFEEPQISTSTLIRTSENITVSGTCSPFSNVELFISTGNILTVQFINNRSIWFTEIQNLNYGQYPLTIVQKNFFGSIVTKNITITKEPNLITASEHSYHVYKDKNALTWGLDYIKIENDSNDKNGSVWIESKLDFKENDYSQTIITQNRWFNPQITIGALTKKTQLIMPWNSSKKPIITKDNKPITTWSNQLSNVLGASPASITIPVITTENVSFYVNQPGVYGISQISNIVYPTVVSNFVSSKVIIPIKVFDNVGNIVQTVPVKFTYQNQIQTINTNYYGIAEFIITLPMFPTQSLATIQVEDLERTIRISSKRK